MENDLRVSRQSHVRTKRKLLRSNVRKLEPESRKPLKFEVFSSSPKQDHVIVKSALLEDVGSLYVVMINIGMHS